LAAAVKDVVKSSFAWISAPQLLNILKWGVDKKRLQAEGNSVIAHQNIVELIVQELYGKINIEVLSQAGITPNDLDNAIAMLEDVPTIEQVVVYLKAVANKYKNSAIKDLVF
jgi:hypothetical protein